MAGDYWLAYETSAENASSFQPSIFIDIYAIIAVIVVVFVSLRAFLVAFLGLQTAQVFFRKILNSILHAPMSFFDTTPSGRILSRVLFSSGHIFLY
jgi:ATP-binding cassette, subfamily C (CFTR/MRP), member 2